MPAPRPAARAPATPRRPLSAWVRQGPLRKGPVRR
jgi:hypothetical protein